ncbi:hypothetical protein [Parapedobacter indicus]|uniref:Uncharacterized protein n=1 Tax=Parapedobacter indicus TaxID=1477437 RepID=A0A1I3IFF3_9SPHI|nr:hypothetical protein [Parapedobacter indicus]PPL02142.1 hypothetical protein CLV26_10467 [Parapedobacter indicus]SFI46599.1 hypothetical protein SAMN05444682_10467 [Parapedobacter indicus]
MTAKKLVICLIALFQVVLPLFANVAVGPLLSGEPIRGWTLLSDNLAQGKSTVDRAKDYHINHLQLSHDIIHDLRHVRDGRRRELAQKLTDYAHKKGIQEVVLWDRALYDLNYYPVAFRTARDGKIDLDNPAFWEWLKNDYREMLDLVPDIQGLVLTFIETGARVEDQYSTKLTTSQQKLAAVVNAIASVVIDERKLNLYARTFSYSDAEYDQIIGAIDLFDNPNIRLMMKEVPHDFLLTHPDDYYAGTLARPTIIEFDATGEFNGQGVIANTWPQLVMRRWGNFSKRPHVIGYTARTDRYGDTGIIGQPGEINLYALKRMGEQPDISVDEVYREFITDRYGARAVPYLEKAFANAFDIVTSTLYTLGINTASHSSLVYHDYVSSYIRHVSGKWLDPPIASVRHNVNKEYHYWKDVVNHLAPVWVKAGDEQFEEIPKVLAAGWLHPRECMNERYLKDILTEKDYGVALASESLEQVRMARASLKAKDYQELYAYFERTWLTASLHRAVSGLYFAHRIYARGAAFRTPFVMETLNKGLVETEKYSQLISAYEGNVPRGEWNWRADADKAMAYHAKIKAALNPPQKSPLETFALDGSRNIMKEQNFGIINGHATCRVNYQDVGTISSFFAPPYASSDFLMELRLFGEKVRTRDYKWYPFEVQRTGEINGLAVSSVTTLPAGKKAGLMVIHLKNQTNDSLVVPVQLHLQGGFNYVKRWDFQRPDARDKTSNHAENGVMVRENKDGRLIIATDFPHIEWFELGSRWDTRIRLAPGEAREYHIGLELGGTALSQDTVRSLLTNADNEVAAARQHHIEEVNQLLDRLPRFHASDKRLEDYYYRSLVTLLTNKWEVPEFALQPYYGSGAVIGGSVTLHLWEFGLPAQIFPLYDANIARAHIKQFLKVDITKRSRFEPMTGEGAGSWYQVNQDKIIELIYYYVVHTGDVDFLNEVVDGLSVYDHVMKNALFGDDLKKDVVLVDYGDEGENHLELQRGYPYRGVMPDVNALRYLSYMRAYELTELAGKPIAALPERAEALKTLLKKELWSARDKWFYFENNGKRGIRYTNFMYTLIGTGIFDEEVEQGLLSHLNEQEFLGDYGIHSISKLDPAYDQNDIDHGGGGSYVAFPPLICQRFYNAGFHSEADDLLERHLWWGERLPYWGDSKVANYLGYREDTPLQSDFDACTAAQTVIFGLFGVKVELDGRITVNPTIPSFSPEIRLEGLKIRGRELTIEANAEEYIVTVDGKAVTMKLGTLVTF